ncbi:class I SAM-dependent methyltransferase [Defluviitalea phaphyphila]|uniref:class I SAM-dependent methyltransferase n=1 Tax=Defluviitalea phaphyphila TaxID=1473580 RepID=UPI000731C88F|nr:class I SAM-dependent methyltransferase [Defluviitalea phaphyphila]
MFLRTKLTDLVHNILKNKINVGDIVVDATVGNGFDTIFLAKAVGDKGKVIGFDIQPQAIESAKKKLYKEGLIERVELIQDSHSNICKYVNHSINGAMFNLGYLPNGNKKIITKKETTIIALNKISSMLVKGGFITIISYLGHPGGMEEKEAIESFLRNINNENFITAKFSYLNRPTNPPIVYIVEKI